MSHWDRVAEAWGRWSARFEAGAAVVTEAMLADAHVGEGSRVLDLACGVGEVARAARARVGASGRVVGLDSSLQMLGVARALGAGPESAGVEWRQGEATALAESGFDAVLCRWGFDAWESYDPIVRGVRASLKPGGRFVAALWGEMPHVPVIYLPLLAGERSGGEPAPDSRHAGMLGFDRLAEVLEREGFENISIQDMEFDLVFDRMEEWLRFVSEISGFARSERFARELTAVTGPYVSGSEIRLPCEVVLVRANKKLC